MISYPTAKPIFFTILMIFRELSKLCYSLYGMSVGMLSSLLLDLKYY